MINIDVRKSLARKNGNGIIIWSWNDSLMSDFLPMVSNPNYVPHII